MHPLFTVKNLLNNYVTKLLAAVVLFLRLIWPEIASAVTVVQQNQNWSDPLTVWQVIQELGDNLNGAVDDFTFRVSTQRENIKQFDYTAQNSRIYDKSNNNSYISGCIPKGSSADKLRGLSFTTSGVPPGFEDVTIDFSCNNYTFIPGHKYLVYITNANMPNAGSNTIFFAAANYSLGGEDLFTGGGVRYGNANKYDYVNNAGSCSPSAYKWGGTNPWHNGCFVWGTPKNDLYFILSNDSPEPKTAVIFIPGIGGSEMKATQDIVWSKDDGHGGTFSHAYAGNEKVWVNQDQAAALGNDDYFDILRLKPDGVTSEADLSLTGDLTPFGYSDIDPFFQSLGYTKGTNFFVFPYDWRKDIRTTQTGLDSLIEEARQKTGLSKVNLVAHSMGGLVARNYISDSGRASKVNKLIELGVPHLGAVSAIKTLMYGTALQKNIFGIIPIGIPSSEVKDVSQNNTGVFQLLPTKDFYKYYDNSDIDYPFPFRDDRDIDKDNTVGVLNFTNIKTLFSNLSHNMTVFGMAEQFHNLIDPLLNQPNGVKLYNIVGSAQPTLGQIRETYWITWPVNLIPKTDEIFINGDDTVPLYSASLKSGNLDLSGGAKIYYVEQKHSDLVSKNGSAMQTVKALLSEDPLPVEVKDEKIYLEGSQLSLDDGELDLYDDQNRHCGLNDKGEIEENIPEVTCTTSGKTRHAFVKKKASKIKVKVTRKNPTNSSKTTNFKKRTYKQDKVSKTTLYKDLDIPQISKVEFTLDPAEDTPPLLVSFPDSTKPDNVVISPTSDIEGSAASDQTPPVTSVQISGTKNPSGSYINPVIITLTGSDTDSGILKIEYSLDDGRTVQTYTGPFTVSTPGETTIRFKSTDNVGDEEIPQSIKIDILPASSPTPSPTPSPTASPTPTSAGSESNSSQTPSENKNPVTVLPAYLNVISGSKETKQSPASTPFSGDVLGTNFSNAVLAANPMSSRNLLSDDKTPEIPKITVKKLDPNLSGLLIVTGRIIALLSLALALTFLKPTPK